MTFYVWQGILKVFWVAWKLKLRLTRDSPCVVGGRGHIAWNKTCSFTIFLRGVK